MNAPPRTTWLQFRLRTLLGACVLAAVGSWMYRWSTWPAHTLQDFDQLVAQERFEEAAARLTCQDGFVVSPDDVAHRVRVARAVCLNSTPQWRSIADLVHGRQTFKVNGNQACFVDTGTVQAHWLIDSMTLERGTIRFNWRGPADPSVRFENGHWIRDEIPWAAAPRR